MPRLTDREIEAGLAAVPGWIRRDEAIEREFAFATFTDAMAFLVRLAFEAEANDHHPDIVIHYRRVTLRYWTHSEGGVTAKDFGGARAADRVAASFPHGA
jgi:4a-hydroxytetrahydrobiopterin dehydratase